MTILLLLHYYNFTLQEGIMNMSNNINEYQIIQRLNYLEEQNRILIAENNELKKKNTRTREFH